MLANISNVFADTYPIPILLYVPINGFGIEG